MIRVAESNIVRAIQQVSTEQGLDPRDFVLVPFGGAGPLHAARVAEELGIATILVPRNAGVLSAAGLLMADYVHYRARTERCRLNEAAMPQIKSILAGLERDAGDYLEQVGIGGERYAEFVLEMRYVGQAFELSVAVDGDLDELTADQVLEAFRAAHHRVFEFSKPPEDPVEMVSYRVGVHARVDAFPFEPSRDGDQDGRHYRQSPDRSCRRRREYRLPFADPRRDRNNPPCRRHLGRRRYLDHLHSTRMAGALRRGRQPHCSKWELNS